MQMRTSKPGAGNKFYITKSKGGDQPHNNLQPYYVAYIWKLVSYSN